VSSDQQQVGTSPACFFLLDIIGNNDVFAKAVLFRLKQSPKGQFFPLNGRLLRHTCPERSAGKAARSDMEHYYR
jgi:hypothetical protein